MQIEMKGISKAFGKNEVLKDVNFSVHGGQVHALMGENGAGKSTLMNILTGLLKADGGQILVDGKEVKYQNALDAEHHGISFIHQEMNNFSEMTVLENMFLNKEITNKAGLLDTKTMRKQAQEVLQRLDADVNLDAEIGTLSVGTQQMIEIAKSLMNDTQILIMDEPSAALTEKEIDRMFEIVKTLQKQGVGVIYISHRMQEIFQITDEITVMRDGLTVANYQTKDTDVQQIVKDMVGRELDDFYPERHPNFGETRLKLTNFTQKGVFNNISFEVKAGEILAFSGLMGAGRTEIMRSLFGIDPHDSGEIEVNGKTVKISSPSDGIKNGIGFLTENRKEEGLILDATIAANIDLPSIDGFVKHGIIDQKADDDFVDMLIKRLTVKATSRNNLAGDLSGGNQQKVVLAKWVGSGSQILILDEPTRGVDVGAKREIYDLMNELTDRGVAIIMISSDLQEVIGFSDRIAVVYEGTLTGEISTADATQEKVMTLATGGKLDE
ncbi:sugar ABC transporter ATP-binding protein [Lentilactobacillus senioris]|uniref:sugar ABC transporter ATP-binding protein n=1 Tax=Lentilactobacillus senioris TaxID=931534 RepID=UPI00227F8928|nr:sugar ABC transporter ATP-binding protein [Lentilactobacillus senioris]MCY9805989.1 sugar ABC transporter ATP-binding protein [Lentilactobacillus senioris]